MAVFSSFLVLICALHFGNGSIKSSQKTNVHQRWNYTLQEDEESLVNRQFPPPSPCNCYYQESCGCICQQPITWEDFQLLPQHFRSCAAFTLALRGGNFHSFPADYFYRIGDVQDFVLDVSNIQFEYLLDPGGETSALNRVTFEVSSYLRLFRITINKEWNWGGFFDLSPTRSLSYCEIQVVQSTVPLLKEDFGRICKGVVTVVNINYCGTMALENRVFTPFYKLNEVDMSNNRVRVLMRSYFPHPANELAVFNFSYNDIRSLPSDMFYGMPSLKSVDLRGNPIATIDESALQPLLKRSLFLRFEHAAELKNYTIQK